MSDILLNYCGSQVRSTLFPYNGIYSTVRNVKFVNFGLFSYFFLIKINHDMFFLQGNKNISLNCYDFPNHSSSLCFYRRIRKGLCSKRNILSVIQRLIYQENIFYFHFSRKNVNKSMLCTRIKARLVYQLV